MKHDYQLNRKVLKTNFEEAPWIYRLGDTYYLEYATDGNGFRHSTAIREFQRGKDGSIPHIDIK